MKVLVSLGKGDCVLEIFKSNNLTEPVVAGSTVSNSRLDSRKVNEDTRYLGSS